MRFACLCFLFLAPGLAAQASDVLTGPMEPLNFLLGEWRGEGWMVTGPESRETSDVLERATAKLGGSILVLEGLGTREVDGETEVVHDALGIVAHDPESGAYTMRAYRTMNGRVAWLDADVEVGEGTLIWGYEDPGAGQVRFTLRLTTDGRWHEVGEATRDGVNWFQFFEMTLSPA